MEDELFEWLLEARQDGDFGDEEIEEVLSNDKSAKLLYDDFVDGSMRDQIEIVRRVVKKLKVHLTHISKFPSAERV